jgi:hypothetical protein
MKTCLATAAFLLFAFAGVAVAKDKWQPATISSMTQVPCTPGSKDSCNEYVVTTTSTQYHIRDQKRGEPLMKVGQEGQCKVQSGKMKVRALDGEGKMKEREFRVVGMEALGSAPPPAPRSQ